MFAFYPPGHWVDGRVQKAHFQTSDRQISFSVHAYTQAFIECKGKTQFSELPATKRSTPAIESKDTPPIDENYIERSMEESTIPPPQPKIRVPGIKSDTSFRRTGGHDECRLSTNCTLTTDGTVKENVQTVHADRLTARTYNSGRKVETVVSNVRRTKIPTRY